MMVPAGSIGCSSWFGQLAQCEGTFWYAPHTGAADTCCVSACGRALPEGWGAGGTGGICPDLVQLLGQGPPPLCS